MIPESKLIKSELVIRDMVLPNEVTLTRKSLMRWLAISLGLILPNESRRLLLDILEVIFSAHVQGEYPTTKDILSLLEQNTKQKPNPKAVYYHLLKLKEMVILSRKKGRYYLGDGDGKRLPDLLKEIYLKKTKVAFFNIEEALKKLEESYKNSIN